MAKEKFSEDYNSGMLVTLSRAIWFILNKVKKIKESPISPNTTRQITNSAKLLAYNDMLTYLYAKQEKVRKYKKGSNES